MNGEIKYNHRTLSILDLDRLPFLRKDLMIDGGGIVLNALKEYPGVDDGFNKLHLGCQDNILQWPFLSTYRKLPILGQFFDAALKFNMGQPNTTESEKKTVAMITALSPMGQLATIPVIMGQDDIKKYYKDSGVSTLITPNGTECDGLSDTILGQMKTMQNVAKNMGKTKNAFPLISLIIPQTFRYGDPDEGTVLRIIALPDEISDKKKEVTNLTPFEYTIIKTQKRLEQIRIKFQKKFPLMSPLVQESQQEDINFGELPLIKAVHNFTKPDEIRSFYKEYIHFFYLLFQYSLPEEYTHGTLGDLEKKLIELANYNLVKIFTFVDNFSDREDHMNKYKLWKNILPEVIPSEKNMIIRGRLSLKP